MPETDKIAQEQEAEEYCLNHKLERPSLRIKVALGVFLLYAVFISFFSVLLHKSLGISQLFAIDMSLLLSLPFAGRRFLIYCIQVYQHFAPEDLRRRCICKPSCSEYSIEVLKKYGLLKGCRKIYIRLTKTCRGEKYIIDNP